MTTTESLCHPSFLSKFTTYWSMYIMLLFGYFREFFGNILFGQSVLKPKEKGFASIYHPKYTVGLYAIYDRCQDMCNRPVTSRPNRVIEIIRRKRCHFYWKPIDCIGKQPKKTKLLNFGSYNYLGFSKTPSHAETHILESVERFGVSSGGNRRYGYNTVIRDLEKATAEYVGKEDALVMGMGYATNSMVMSALCGEGDLILADKLSHSSSWTGFKLSNAEYHTFQHNDVEDLERLIRFYISRGVLKNINNEYVPLKRIWVMFEGIYSMEGEFPPLEEIVELKKKYGLYLYMDEAHSIGGTGRTGRGTCEVTGVNPKHIDVLMGTFTKAFGSVGGYIASNKRTIKFLRDESQGTLFGTSLPPPCAMQVFQCSLIMRGKDGTRCGKDRIKKQRKNAIRLYRKLKEIGVEVVGEEGSPVLCVMLYNLSKMIAFSRLTLRRGLAVCTCGFPATELIEMRARLCVSAQHTEQDIDNCVEIINDVANLLLLKYDLPWYKRIINLLI